MTRSILDLFFDLGPIPEDASGLEIGWMHPLPGWLWFLIVLVTLGFSVWSYSRLIGPRWIRGLLAIARSLVILLVIALVCGPEISYPREVVEEDLVLVMVDRSSSMSIRDSVIDGERVSRDRSLRSIFDDDPGIWRTIGERSELRWIGFSSGAYPLDVDDSGLPDFGEPDGWRTDLGSSIRQALDEHPRNR